MISKDSFVILMDGYRKNCDALGQLNDLFGVNVDEGPLGSAADAIILAMLNEFGGTNQTLQHELEDDFMFFWEVYSNEELKYGASFMLSDGQPYIVNSYESFYDYLSIKYFFPN